MASFEQAAQDIFNPVLESAMIIAAEYALKCNRKVVTKTDVSYGLKFAARKVTGKQVGTLFPEFSGDSDDDFVEFERRGGV